MHVTVVLYRLRGHRHEKFLALNDMKFSLNFLLFTQLSEFEYAEYLHHCYARAFPNGRWNILYKVHSAWCILAQTRGNIHIQRVRVCQKKENPKERKTENMNKRERIKAAAAVFSANNVADDDKYHNESAIFLPFTESHVQICIHRIWTRKKNWKRTYAIACV